MDEEVDRLRRLLLKKDTELRAKSEEIAQLHREVANLRQQLSEQNNQTNQTSGHQSLPRLFVSSPEKDHRGGSQEDHQSPLRNIHSASRGETVPFAVHDEVPERAYSFDDADVRVNSSRSRSASDGDAFGSPILQRQQSSAERKIATPPLLPLPVRSVRAQSVDNLSVASNDEDFASAYSVGGTDLGCMIESDRSLSESSMYSIMESFYKKRHVNVWKDGVIPNFITTNCFVATHYANLIASVLKDAAIYAERRLRRQSLHRGSLEVSPGEAPRRRDPVFDPRHPVTIVECGCGMGKFAFLVLKNLMPRIEAMEIPWRIRYVLTDLSEGNLEFAEQHENLRQYFESGVLEIGHFSGEIARIPRRGKQRDAASAEKVSINLSSGSVDMGSLINPPIVIANYVLCNLRADAFYAHEGLDGRLDECRMALFGAEEMRDIDVSSLSLESIVPTWTNVPLSRSDRVQLYENDALSAIVLEYAERLDDASFTIPVAAIALIEAIRSLHVTRKCIVLSADKAITSERDLPCEEALDFAVDGDAFSILANFDCIGKCATRSGGFALLPSESAHESAEYTLSVCIFSFGVEERLLPGTIDTYREGIDKFTVMDYMHIVENTQHVDLAAQDTDPNRLLRGIMVLLRVSFFDPDIFLNYSSDLLAIIDGVPHLGDEAKAEIATQVSRVRENYFHCSDDDDVPLELGRVMFAIGRVVVAFSHFQQSLRMFGRHFATMHNIGLCYYEMGRFSDAVNSFEAALRLNPSYTPARTWIARVGKKVTSMLDDLPEGLRDIPEESAEMAAAHAAPEASPGSDESDGASSANSFEYDFE